MSEVQDGSRATSWARAGSLRAVSAGVTTSLRQRHADRTRTALVDAALDLFDEHGFAATTVDQIAARADVAPRTFFRYFATKEAVVYHDAADVVGRMCETLLDRPAPEPPHRSLLGVLTEMGDELAADRKRMLLIHRLSKEDDRVLDYQRVLLRQFEQEIVETLALRSGIDSADLDLWATSAALLSSLGVAFRSWVDAGATGPLRPYITRAVDACRRAFADEEPDD